MPGFVVNGVGGNGNSAKATETYYYTYTWEIKNIFGDNDDALINAKDMTLPVFNVSKENVPGASLEYKFAKSVNWDDIKISWYDTVGMIDVIRRWRESVWTPNSGLQPASDYKKESRVTTYSPDRKNDTANDVDFLLHNSWPSIIRHGDLSYTNSDIKLIDVTLTYDWAEEYSQIVSGGFPTGTFSNLANFP